MGYVQEASQVALVVKNPPARAGDGETKVWSPGQEDALEEEMATHSSVLAWRIPRTAEATGPQRSPTRRVTEHTHEQEALKGY